MQTKDLYIQFRAGIKAWGMEDYKGITIVYLSKHANDEINKEAKERCIYHVIINGELNAGEADNLEELKDLAHKDIDDYLDNKQGDGKEDIKKQE